VISYTEEDYKDFMSYLSVGFEPRAILNDANDKIRYYICLSLQSYGQDIMDEALKIMFEEPLDNMPLYINHEIKVSSDRAILLNKIAYWRLRRAK
jgi:hypothetical protein